MKMRTRKRERERERMREAYAKSYDNLNQTGKKSSSHWDGQAQSWRREEDGRVHTSS
jgi:hypothetical protein